MSDSIIILYAGVKICTISIRRLFILYRNIYPIQLPTTMYSLNKLYVIIAVTIFAIFIHLDLRLKVKYTAFISIPTRIFKKRSKFYEKGHHSVFLNHRQH